MAQHDHSLLLQLPEYFSSFWIPEGWSYISHVILGLSFQMWIYFSIFDDRFAQYWNYYYSDLNQPIPNLSQAQSSMGPEVLTIRPISLGPSEGRHTAYIISVSQTRLNGIVFLSTIECLRLGGCVVKFCRGHTLKREGGSLTLSLDDSVTLILRNDRGIYFNGPIRFANKRTMDIFSF